jgi:hypothetical protein
MFTNTDSFAALEKERTAYARSHRGTSANVILPTGETAISPEREITAALTSEIYENYLQERATAQLQAQLRVAVIKLA